MGVHDVAQGAEQHFTRAGDHFAIHKGISRSVQQLKANPPILLMNTHFEVFVRFKDGFGIVDMGAGVEDGQHTLAEQGVTGA